MSLRDSIGREISYLRLSLTDRCNFRCVYCMPEDMQFSPRDENLSVDELLLLCEAFTELGVKKIRLTGGEPLLHPDAPGLINALESLPALKQLAITTNGALLKDKLAQIHSSKLVQMNISIDSLDPENFREITRTGKLEHVLQGIDAAIAKGIERIRLNAVVSKGLNDDQVLDLVRFAIDKGVHVAFIEEMPLGDMQDYQRAHHYISNEEVLDEVRKHFDLTAIDKKHAQAGPADYYQVVGSSTQIGFISPHSNKFCSSCNRVRVTRKGELVLCLGQDDAVDLRPIIRGAVSRQAALAELKQSIESAMALKPKEHDFSVSQDSSAVQVVRFMNVTGG